MQGGAAHQRDFGLLDACVGIVIRPAPTLARVSERRPLGMAFAVIIAAGLLRGGLEAVRELLDEPDAAPAAANVVEPLAIGLALAIAITVILAACFLLSSRFMSGHTTYRALFCGLSIILAVPFILAVGVDFIGLIGDPIAALAFYAYAVAIIWMGVLSVILLREANRFSILRSIIAFILSLIPVVALGMFAAVIILFFVAIDAIFDVMRDLGDAIASGIGGRR